MPLTKFLQTDAAALTGRSLMESILEKLQTSELDASLELVRDDTTQIARLSPTSNQQNAHWHDLNQAKCSRITITTWNGKNKFMIQAAQPTNMCALLCEAMQADATMLGQDFIDGCGRKRRLSFQSPKAADYTTPKSTDYKDLKGVNYTTPKSTDYPTPTIEGSMVEDYTAQAGTVSKVEDYTKGEKVVGYLRSLGSLAQHLLVEDQDHFDLIVDAMNTGPPPKSFLIKLPKPVLQMTLDQIQTTLEPDDGTKQNMHTQVRRSLSRTLSIRAAISSFPLTKTHPMNDTTAAWKIHLTVDPHGLAARALLLSASGYLDGIDIAQAYFKNKEKK